MGYTKYEIEKAISDLKSMVSYRRVRTLTEPECRINIENLIKDERQLEKLQAMLIEKFPNKIVFK